MWYKDIKGLVLQFVTGYVEVFVLIFRLDDY